MCDTGVQRRKLPSAVAAASSLPAVLTSCNSTTSTNAKSSSPAQAPARLTKEALMRMDKTEGIDGRIDCQVTVEKVAPTQSDDLEKVIINRELKDLNVSTITGFEFDWSVRIEQKNHSS